MPRRSSAIAFVLAVLALTAWAAPEAVARERYVFLVSRVDLGKGVPHEVEAQVLARLGAAIAGHEELESALAKDAPDPGAEPNKFKQYVKAKGRRVFKVNVEVSQYSIEVEPGPGPGGRSGTERRASQYVTVRVALRLFGETVPDRVMAFTGDGSATVKIEVGKTVRPRDREEATSAALDQAVASAIAESLARLKQPPPSSGKKKRGKA